MSLESILELPSRYIANSPRPPLLDAAIPTPVIEDDESKKHRYRLLNQAANLCLNHRVSHCCRTIQNRDKPITINKRYDIADKDTSRFSFSGLQTCGSVHICPHCAPYIASVREKEIEHCVKHWHASDKLVVFLTLTHPHTEDMSLDFQLGGMLGRGEKKRGGAISRFTRSKAWARMNKAGYIRRIEATRGKYNGWHPHTHWLIAINREADGSFFFDGAELAMAWCRACLNSDLPAPSWERGFCFDYVDHDAKALGKYVAKMGTWTLASEMSKSHLKKGKSSSRSPWQLLADSETCSKSADLFIEYADAIKGVRSLIWSRGLKDEIGLVEFTDNEISEERATVEELIYTFSNENVSDSADDCYKVKGIQKFNMILARGSRLECLKLARSGGSKAVHDYIWGLIKDYRRDWEPLDHNDSPLRMLPDIQPKKIRMNS